METATVWMSVRSRGLVRNTCSASPRDIEGLLKRYSGEANSWVKAIDVMRGALELNLVPTRRSYRYALDVVARDADWRIGVRLVDHMRTSRQSSHALFRLFLQSASRYRPQNCVEVLHQIHKRAVPPIDIPTYVVIADRLLQLGKWDDALQLPQFFQKDKIPPTKALCSLLLRAAAEGGRWEEACLVHRTATGLVAFDADMTSNFLKSFTDTQWAAAIATVVRHAEPEVLKSSRVLVAMCLVLRRGGQWKRAFSAADRVVRQLHYSGSDAAAVFDEQLPLLPWRTALHVYEHQPMKSSRSATALMQALPSSQAALLLRLMSESAEAAIVGLPKINVSMWREAMNAVMRSGDVSGTACIELAALLQRCPGAPEIGDTIDGLIKLSVGNVHAESSVRRMCEDGLWLRAITVCDPVALAAALMEKGEWVAALRVGCLHRTLNGMRSIVEDDILKRRSLWEEAIRYAQLTPSMPDVMRTLVVPLCAAANRHHIVRTVLSQVPELTTWEKVLLDHAILDDEMNAISEAYSTYNWKAMQRIFRSHKDRQGPLQLPPMSLLMVAKTFFDADRWEECDECIETAEAQGFSSLIATNSSAALLETLRRSRATSETWHTRRQRLVGLYPAGRDLGAHMVMTVLGDWLKGRSCEAFETLCCLLEEPFTASDVASALRTNRPLRRRLGLILAQGVSMGRVAEVAQLLDAIGCEVVTRPRDMQVLDPLFIALLKLQVTESPARLLPSTATYSQQTMWQSSLRLLSHLHSSKLLPSTALVNMVASSIPKGNAFMWDRFLQTTCGTCETGRSMLEGATAMAVQGRWQASLDLLRALNKASFDSSEAVKHLTTSVAAQMVELGASCAQSEVLLDSDPAALALMFLDQKKWAAALDLCRNSTRPSAAVARRVWVVATTQSQQAAVSLEVLGWLKSTFGYAPQHADFSFALECIKASRGERSLVDACEMIASMPCHGLSPDDEQLFVALSLCAFASASALSTAKKILEPLKQLSLANSETLNQMITLMMGGEGSADDTPAVTVAIGKDVATRGLWTPQRLSALGSDVPQLRLASANGHASVIDAATAISQERFHGLVPPSAIVQLWCSREGRDRLERLHTSKSAAPLGAMEGVPASVMRFAAKHSTIIRFCDSVTVNRLVAQTFGSPMVKQWPYHRWKTLLNSKRKEISQICREMPREEILLPMDVPLSAINHRMIVRFASLVTLSSEPNFFDVLACSVCHSAIDSAHAQRLWSALLEDIHAAAEKRWDCKAEAELVQAVESSPWGVTPTSLTSMPSATRESIAAYWAAYGEVLQASAYFNTVEMAFVGERYFKSLDEVIDNGSALSQLCASIAASHFCLDAEHRTSPWFQYHRGADVEEMVRKSFASLSDIHHSSLEYTPTAHLSPETRIVASSPMLHCSSPKRSGSASNKTSYPVGTTRWKVALTILDKLQQQSENARLSFRDVAVFLRITQADGMNCADALRLVQERFDTEGFAIDEELYTDAVTLLPGSSSSVDWHPLRFVSEIGDVALRNLLSQLVTASEHTVNSLAAHLIATLEGNGTTTLEERRCIFDTLIRSRAFTALEPSLRRQLSALLWR